MKISVNLATHPYIELRPVYSRLRTWTVILALVGLALYGLYRSERDQARAATARVAAVRSHVNQLQQQRQHYVQLMEAPNNAAILKQSDFLNSLFRRKAFSWTATISDLETVLPAGVQVRSIDPIVAPDGHVIIRLRVIGDRSRAIDLIRNLEHSEHFIDPRLASESVATENENGSAAQNVSTGNNLVNFDILADYRPLPLPAPKEPADAEQPKPEPKAAAPSAAAHPATTPPVKAPPAKKSAGKARPHAR